MPTRSWTMTELALSSSSSDAPPHPLMVTIAAIAEATSAGPGAPFEPRARLPTPS